MKILLYLFIIFSLISCSTGEAFEREHGGRDKDHTEEDYPKLPDGSPYSEKDIAEMNDNTVRYSSNGLVLKFGEPGILYTLSADNDRATLRGLSSEGQNASFILTTRRMELNGKIIAYDAVRLKEEEKIEWWRAFTPADSLPVYFIIEKF